MSEFDLDDSFANSIKRFFVFESKMLVIGPIVFLAIAGGIFGIFYFSKTDREKDEIMTSKCLEKTSLNEKYKNIDEATANYDFALARKYLSCYPDRGYIEGESNSLYFGSGKASTNGDGNLYQSNLEKITRSEVAFLILNGETSRAQAVASESNMKEIYKESLPDVINLLIEKKDYHKIFPILAGWKLTDTFNPDGPPNSEYYNGNFKYNEDVQFYNSIIDNVLKNAIINDDPETARKCLLIYSPNAVLDPATKKRTESDQKSILRNKARSAAIITMKESGMKVKITP